MSMSVDTVDDALLIVSTTVCPPAWVEHSEVDSQDGEPGEFVGEWSALARSPLQRRTRMFAEVVQPLMFVDAERWALPEPRIRLCVEAMDAMSTDEARDLAAALYEAAKLREQASAATWILAAGPEANRL